MAQIVYLDVDDEITSAASRIRGAADRRVTLVVPYGSRLATSRINFRLLAREAQGRDRRLAIVAGDAATRALAASAGLPVFSTVSEFEEAEKSPRARTAAGVATAPAPRRRADDEPAAAPPDAPPTSGNGGRRKRVPAAAAGVAAEGAAAEGATGEGVSGEADGARRADEARRSTELGAAGQAGEDGRSTGILPAIAATAATLIGGTPAGAGRRTAPAFPGIGLRRRLVWPYGRTAGIAVAGVLGLAVLAAGVAGYLLLPSADITITTRTESIGPIPIEVRADPSVSATDLETGTIPAQRLTFDVAVSDTFQTTGRRIVRNRAKGAVTFENYDPTAAKSIGAGSIVSTPEGVRFRTTGAVDVPAGTLVVPEVVPGQASVAIEAVDAGPGGNVPANSITVIPAGQDPTFVRVRNPEPTTGGRRREFPRIAQEDIDAAIGTLQPRLTEAFAAILADATQIPADLKLFPETAALVDPLPTTDPATLLNQEVPEFQLGLATTGTVLAVDEAPIESIARARITSAVDNGYRLVDGSISFAAGPPFVSGETISYPVTASGKQLRIVDAEALREEVKGKPIAEARAILERYGDVELSVWPDWVATVPTLDGRLTLRVEAPPGTPPAARPTPRPSRSPSASPGGSPGESPPGSGAESAVPSSPSGSPSVSEASPAP